MPTQFEVFVNSYTQKTFGQLSESLTPQLQNVLTKLKIKGLSPDQITGLSKRIATETARESLETIPKITSPSQGPDLLKDCLVRTLLADQTLLPKLRKMKPSKIEGLIAPVTNKAFADNKKALEVSAILGTVSRILKFEQNRPQVDSQIDERIAAIITRKHPTATKAEITTVQGLTKQYLTRYIQVFENEVNPPQISNPQSAAALSYDDLIKTKDKAHQEATKSFKGEAAKAFDPKTTLGKQVSPEEVTSEVADSFGLTQPDPTQTEALTSVTNNNSSAIFKASGFSGFGVGLLLGSTTRVQEEAYLSLLAHDGNRLDTSIGQLEKQTRSLQVQTAGSPDNLAANKEHADTQTHLSILERARSFREAQPKRFSAYISYFDKLQGPLRAASASNIAWETTNASFGNSPRFSPQYPVSQKPTQILAARTFNSISSSISSVQGSIKTVKNVAQTAKNVVKIVKNLRYLTAVTPAAIATLLAPMAFSLMRRIAKIASGALGGMMLYFLLNGGLAGALLGATIGGMVGMGVGAVLGFQLGVALAPFTFGLSIPICTFLGAWGGSYIGAAIGSFAGGMISMGLSSGSLTAAATGVGAGVGGITGGIIGASVGATAGGIIGGFIGSAFGPAGTIVGAAIGAKLGAFVGASVGAPAGAFLGAVAGFAIGKVLSTTVGSVAAGAGIGFMVGGPAGAVVGAGIGWLAHGGFSTIKSFFSGSSSGGTGGTTGAIASGMFSSFFGGIANLAVMLWNGALSAVGGFFGAIGSGLSFLAGGLTFASIPAVLGLSAIGGLALVAGLTIFIASISDTTKTATAGDIITKTATANATVGSLIDYSIKYHDSCLPTALITDTLPPGVDFESIEAGKENGTWDPNAVDNVELIEPADISDLIPGITKIIWKVTLKGDYVKSCSSNPIPPGDLIVGFSLDCETLKSAGHPNPSATGCNLFNEAGTALGTPPGFLAGIHQMETSGHIFDFTDAEVTTYGAEGAMEPSCDTSYTGAQGPMQFQPTTWVGYVDRVKAILSRSSVNPCNLYDAVYGASIKLKGDSGTTTLNTPWDRPAVDNAAGAYLGSCIDFVTGYPYCDNAWIWYQSFSL